MGEATRTCTESQTAPNDAPIVVPSNLLDLDFSTGKFSKTEIAAGCGKSEGAVRKALKTLQQAVPLDKLERDRKLTQLGATLILSLFERPEYMSQAEWLHVLQTELAAIPDTRLFEPDDPSDRVQKIEQKRSEANALALRNETDLDAFFARFLTQKAQQEQEAEADEDIEYQEAYQAEIEALQRRFKARMQARVDFERKFQSYGL